MRYYGKAFRPTLVDASWGSRGSDRWRTKVVEVKSVSEIIWVEGVITWQKRGIDSKRRDYS